MNLTFRRKTVLYGRIFSCYYILQKGNWEILKCVHPKGIRRIDSISPFASIGLSGKLSVLPPCCCQILVFIAFA